MATTHTGSVLTPEQRQQAEEDGYIIIKGLLSLEECRTYIERLHSYTHGRRTLPVGMALQREPRVDHGELQATPGDDVRKVSGVAYGDDLFRGLAHQPRVVAIMQELMSPNLKLFRADVLMKPAGVGSAKGMHQDSPYWPIAPMALWSCWLPFDAATLENGCMNALPGSHKGGVLPHVHVTDDFVVAPDHYDGSGAVPFPMEPGSGLFFHSLLVHGTAENRSSLPRRAIVLSYMAAEYHYTGPEPKPDYLHISGVAVPGGV